MSTRDLDAYSPLKATRHLDIVEGVRLGWPARPAHVQVILSDTCNHSCFFCAYRDPAYTSSQLFYEVREGAGGLRRDADHPERDYNPRRQIPYDKVIEILDDCVEMKVSGVQLTGGGEPTTHPDFARILQATIERGLPFSLVTNGTLLANKPELLKLVARAAWVRVSLDAGRADTYARTRGVGPQAFDKVCAAITGLDLARRDAGTACVLGVGYVVTPENWQEVGEATALVKRLGADNIRVSAQFSSEDEKLFAECHDRAASVCRAAETLADERFQVYNRFGAKLDDLRQHRPNFGLCGYQYFTTYIGANLDVYRCCVIAYNERGRIGSLAAVPGASGALGISGRRFKDFWMDDERAGEMAAFDPKTCDRCQFTGINRILDYVLRVDDPPHSEFV